MKKILSIIFIVIMLAGLGVASYFVAKDIETTSADQPVVETPEIPSEDENEEGSQVAWADLIGAHIMSSMEDFSSFDNMFVLDEETGILANAVGFVITEKELYFTYGIYDGVDTFSFFKESAMDRSPYTIVSYENNVFNLKYADGNEFNMVFEKNENGNLVFDSMSFMFVKNIEIKIL